MLRPVCMEHQITFHQIAELGLIWTGEWGWRGRTANWSGQSQGPRSGPAHNWSRWGQGHMRRQMDLSFKDWARRNWTSVRNYTHISACLCIWKSWGEYSCMYVVFVYLCPWFWSWYCIDSECTRVWTGRFSHDKKQNQNGALPASKQMYYLYIWHNLICRTFVLQQRVMWIHNHRSIFMWCNSIKRSQ